MNFIAGVVGLLIIAFLIWFGIKNVFQYKQSQGKETSNAPVKLAIISLLGGFVAIVGLAPLVADMIAQLLSNIPGIKIRGTQSSEQIGLVAYAILCLAIVLVIFLYYRNRHRLYQDSTGASSHTVHQKNVIENSQLTAGGDIHIGDNK